MELDPVVAQISPDLGRCHLCGDAPVFYGAGGWKTRLWERMPLNGRATSRWVEVVTKGDHERPVSPIGIVLALQYHISGVRRAKQAEYILSRHAQVKLAQNACLQELLQRKVHRVLASIRSFDIPRR